MATHAGVSRCSVLGVFGVVGVCFFFFWMQCHTGCAGAGTSHHHLLYVLLPNTIVHNRKLGWEWTW
jgi:hypothetical protein